MTEAILVAESVTKSYDGVHALRGVTFTVRRDAVNVLVGENGAGKSTLMKILAGAEQPTAGRVLLDGEPIVLDSPRAAMAAGIGIIHQELNLFPNLSIAENMFAGRELAGWRGIDFREQRDRTRAALARLGQHLDPDTLVADLPIGQQQLVEIARTLSTSVRVLIMDEPTSALSNHEVEVLFRVMRELRADGVTAIYISHKLDELRQIGDYITVLRDGRAVAQAAMADTDTAWIVRQMVGQDPAKLFTRSRRQRGEALLEVTSLTVSGPHRPLVDDVSLTVHKGEVVGIYGLMGAGRTELLEALIGLRPATGTIRVGGKPVGGDSVGDRLAAGLALVPEDRQRDGLVQTMSVRDNLVLATLRSLRRRLLLATRKAREVAREQQERLSIKVPGLGALVTTLSGGNQQKVVLGRALLTDPVVLLLDEPTRGIDVGAKSQIAAIMSELAEDGLGVLFVSSELAEITALADRVLVMAQGRITATFDAAEVTEERLVAASAPDSQQEVSA